MGDAEIVEAAAEGSTVSHSTDGETGSFVINPTATAEECMLLTISAELRNRIYELVVVEDSIIHVSLISEDFNFCDRSEPAVTQPALTKTCRQIREESLPIFYGLNRFWISTYAIQCMKSSMCRVHPTLFVRADLLRHIRITMGGQTYYFNLDIQNLKLNLDEVEEPQWPFDEDFFSDGNQRYIEGQAVLDEYVRKHGAG